MTKNFKIYLQSALYVRTTSLGEPAHICIGAVAIVTTRVTSPTLMSCQVRTIPTARSDKRGTNVSAMIASQDFIPLYMRNLSTI